MGSFPLLTRGEFQPVKLLRILLAQAAGEAFDAVVAGRKALLVHQVLVDGGEVTL